MDATFWHSCWERNTIGFHQVDYHPWLERYVLPELNNAHSNNGQLRVLVPLCGKSDDMWWFAQHTEVVGAELSNIACQDFFADKNIPVTPKTVAKFKCYQQDNISLWQGDFLSLTKTQIGDFDFIYDRAALIAMPPSMQQNYVDKLSSFIDEGTTLLLISLTYPEGELQGPPFSVDEERIRQLFAGFDVKPIASADLANKKFAQRTFDVGHLIESFYLISPI